MQIIFKKKGKKFDTSFITSFAANVGSPAMIIYALNVKNVSFESSFDTKNEMTIKTKKYPTIRKRMKVGVIIYESFLN